MCDIDITFDNAIIESFLRIVKRNFHPRVSETKKPLASGAELCYTEQGYQAAGRGVSRKKGF
jgi:hypothetical protein